MLTDQRAALQEQIVAFIRAFGLHRPDQTACGQPVSVSEAHALMELAAGEPLRPAVLAQRLRLEKSTVSRLVRHLEKQSWVTREPDRTDGRAVRLRLTDSGRAAAEKLARARAEKFDALVGSLPDPTRDQVIESFRVLVEVLDAQA
jgi:DNA-binding MarR family transcriptional regulator